MELVRKTADSLPAVWVPTTRGRSWNENVPHACPHMYLVEYLLFYCDISPKTKDTARTAVALLLTCIHMQFLCRQILNGPIFLFPVHSTSSDNCSPMLCLSWTDIPVPLTNPQARSQAHCGSVTHSCKANVILRTDPPLCWEICSRASLGQHLSEAWPPEANVTDNTISVFQLHTTVFRLGHHNVGAYFCLSTDLPWFIPSYHEISPTTRSLNGSSRQHWNPRVFITYQVFEVLACLFGTFICAWSIMLKQIKFTLHHFGLWSSGQVTGIWPIITFNTLKFNCEVYWSACSHSAFALGLSEMDIQLRCSEVHRMTEWWHMNKTGRQSTHVFWLPAIITKKLILV